jgi:hypothetical protein
MDIDAIIHIPLSMRRQEDFWAWHHETNGIFTVRSAYRMMVEAKRRRDDYYESRANCSNEATRWKEWRKLWNM